MIPRGGFLAFLALALPALLLPMDLRAAESQSVILIPPAFYPGDIVEARIALDEALLAGGFSLEDPGLASADGSVVVRKISTGGSGSKRWISIEFSSYAPGENSLPAFSAEGIGFGPIPIETGSIFVAEPEEFRSYRPQRVLPGTIGFLYVFAAAVILGLGLIYSAAAFGFPLLARLLASYRERQPGRIFLSRAAQLSSALGDLAPYEYYARLAFAAREYFCARIDPGFAAFTAREIVSISSGVLREDAELLARVFRRAELVRFGGEESGEEERRRDLLALRRIAEKIEEGMGW